MLTVSHQPGQMMSGAGRRIDRAQSSKHIHPCRGVPSGCSGSVWKANLLASMAQISQSLSRLRGRYEDAVQALRRAEQISPHHVQRDPITRDVLAELLTRIRPDSPAGRELRRMAYRAGLPG